MTLAERIEAVSMELADIVANAEFDPDMQREIGRLSMASFFLKRVVEERRRRRRGFVPRGGIDCSVPLGDR